MTASRTGWPAVGVVMPCTNALSQAYAFELNWYLPDDLLKKVTLLTLELWMRRHPSVGVAT